MTPFARGGVLRAAEGAPRVDVDALAAGGVLVLAPHPDDETLGCGAALGAAAAAGHAVHVVAATDGDGSHPGSARWPRERVAAHRAGELAAALEVLGGGRATHERLGCPDQGVPRADSGAGRALVERLTACVLERRPAHVWTTWEGDPHVDHRRCAALVRAVIAGLGRADRRPGRRVDRRVEPDRVPTLVRFPVWGRFVEAGPGDDELVRFRPDPDLRAAKARALACHASQMTALIDDDPDGFVMPAAMQAHFVEHDELFVRRRAAA